MPTHSREHCRNLAKGRCASRPAALEVVLHFGKWRTGRRLVSGGLSHKTIQCRQLANLRAKRRSLFYSRVGRRMLDRISETVQRAGRTLLLWVFVYGKINFENLLRAPHLLLGCARLLHQEISQHRRTDDSRQARGDRRPDRIMRSPYRWFEDALPHSQYLRHRHSLACWPKRQSPPERRFPTESIRRLNCEIPAAMLQLDSSEKAVRTRGPQSSTQIDTELAHTCRSFGSLSTTSAESMPRTLASGNRTAIS
jgi:hypothetical protein